MYFRYDLETALKDDEVGLTVKFEGLALLLLSNKFPPPASA